MHGWFFLFLLLSTIVSVAITTIEYYLVEKIYSTEIVFLYLLSPYYYINKSLTIFFIFFILQALKMVPTRSLSNIPIIGAAFGPPVSVDTVGKAAASAVLDDQVPAGVMDVWDIKKYA